MESFDFSMPRFKELPKVPLYKEQVITYLEELRNYIAMIF